MEKYLRSMEVLERNQQYIPGGVLSGARKVEPVISFCRARGACLWDLDGNRYIDYHAAFAPHLLGHNDPHVNQAARKVLDGELSLFGSGPTVLEGRLAELICTHAPAVERIEFLNTGSEAVLAALRLARTATGRDHVIVMQGGFNGSHNELACNVLTPLERVGRGSAPANTPTCAWVRACRRPRSDWPTWSTSTTWTRCATSASAIPSPPSSPSPCSRTWASSKPRPGYLQGLRQLADHYGFVLVFDEVKTGFRHGLGGYSRISGVQPDLVVYAKAIANGFPLAVLGGKTGLMDYFALPDPERRPPMGGTYNGHPLSLAAAIATIERLLADGGAVYRRLEHLGSRMQAGIEALLGARGIEGLVSRLGSAFSIYFMDHEPRDWHDLAAHHDFRRDVAMRRALIDAGVYFFPGGHQAVLHLGGARRRGRRLHPGSPGRRPRGGLRGLSRGRRPYRKLKSARIR